MTTKTEQILPILSISATTILSAEYNGKPKYRFVPVSDSKKGTHGVLNYKVGLRDIEEKTVSAVTVTFSEVLVSNISPPHMYGNGNVKNFTEPNFTVKIVYNQSDPDSNAKYEEMKNLNRKIFDDVFFKGENSDLMIREHREKLKESNTRISSAFDIVADAIEEFYKTNDSYAATLCDKFNIPTDDIIPLVTKMMKYYYVIDNKGEIASAQKPGGGTSQIGKSIFAAGIKALSSNRPNYVYYSLKVADYRKATEKDVNEMKNPASIKLITEKFAKIRMVKRVKDIPQLIVVHPDEWINSEPTTRDKYAISNIAIDLKSGFFFGNDKFGLDSRITEISVLKIQERVADQSNFTNDAEMLARYGDSARGEIEDDEALAIKQKPSKRVVKKPVLEDSEEEERPASKKKVKKPVLEEDEEEEQPVLKKKAKKPILEEDEEEEQPVLKKKASKKPPVDDDSDEEPPIARKKASKKAPDSGDESPIARKEEGRSASKKKPPTDDDEEPDVRRSTKRSDEDE